MSNRFDLILACYRSGQMTEAQWQAELENELFRAWVEKRR